MRFLLGMVLAAFLSTSVFAQPITVVSYNVGNLFDADDDPSNPRDDTYLPLAWKDQNRQSHNARCEQYNGKGTRYFEECANLNWDEATYTQKLQRIGEVLTSIPTLPDIVVLPETENKKVLDDLVQRHLASAGYSVVQLDTSDEPDSRGIDVGILTKLPLIGTPKAHAIDFETASEKCGKTRDIVEVTV